MNYFKPQLIITLCFVAAIFIVPSMSCGSDAELTKEIDGIVSYINSVSITVVYDQDQIEGIQKEIALSRNDDIRYGNRRWDDLKAGDHVKVSFVDQLTQDEHIKADGVVETVNRITERRVKDLIFQDNKNG